MRLSLITVTKTNVFLALLLSTGTVAAPITNPFKAKYYDDDVAYESPASHWMYNHPKIMGTGTVASIVGAAIVGAKIIAGKRSEPASGAPKDAAEGTDLSKNFNSY